MVIFLLFVLGLILGSFVNALVWRLHEQSKGQKRKRSPRAKSRDFPAAAVDLSILHGRSMCPHCHHTLAARDLVPVFSWLALRGRCRYCRAPISPQYPLVELLTGALFALTYLCWPETLAGSQWLLLGFTLAYIVLFMALAVYDIRWFLLPDRLVSILTALAVVQVVVMSLLASDPWAALWPPVVGAAIIFGLFWGLYQASGGAWIGGGDVKLAVALGLIAGSPLSALLVIFFASLLGTLGSLPAVFRGGKGLKQHIPFGPYLLTACLLVVLFGERITSWYQGIFL